MAKFTFLEFHLDDATITNNAPYSGAEGSDEDTGDEAADESGRSILGLVALALVLAVGAALAARALSGSGESIDELVEEIDQ